MTQLDIFAPAEPGTELGVFTFAETGQEIQTVVIDGSVWLVAPPIARTLGHRDAADMLRSLDPDEKGTHGLRTCRSVACKPKNLVNHSTDVEPLAHRHVADEDATERLFKEGLPLVVGRPLLPNVPGLVALNGNFGVEKIEVNPEEVDSVLHSVRHVRKGRRDDAQSRRLDRGCSMDLNTQGLSNADGSRAPRFAQCRSDARLGNEDQALTSARCATRQYSHSVIGDEARKRCGVSIANCLRHVGRREPALAVSDVNEWSSDVLHGAKGTRRGAARACIRPLANLMTVESPELPVIPRQRQPGAT